MKAQHVHLGGVYWVRVSGRLAKVRLDREHWLNGWIGYNLETRREVRIRTAGRLRGPVHSLDAKSPGDEQPSLFQEEATRGH
jgi:hypothetical protein